MSNNRKSLQDKDIQKRRVPVCVYESKCPFFGLQVLDTQGHPKTQGGCLRETQKQACKSLSHNDIQKRKNAGCPIYTNTCTSGRRNPYRCYTTLTGVVYHRPGCSAKSLPCENAGIEHIGSIIPRVRRRRGRSPNGAWPNAIRRRGEFYANGSE